MAMTMVDVATIEPLTHHEAVRRQALDVERTLDSLRSLDDHSWAAAAAYFRRPFPDWHSDIEQLFTKGDLVAERFHRTRHPRWRTNGRYAHRPGDDPARNQHLPHPTRPDITERWGRLGQLGLLRQLGLAPAAAAGQR